MGTASVTPAVQDGITLAVFLLRLFLTFPFYSSYQMTGSLHPKCSELENTAFTLTCPLSPSSPKAQKLKFFAFFAKMWPIHQLTQHLIQRPPAVSVLSQLLRTRALGVRQVLPTRGAR